VLVNESLYARQSLLGRMRQIVTGDGATPESSFNLGGPQVVAPGAPTDDPRRGASPFPVKAPPARSVQDGPDIAFWAHGFGAWGRLASDGNAAALDTNFTGFFSGVDARLASIWRAGVAAGYTQSRNTLSGRGAANIEAGHLAAYSTLGLGPLSLRTGADYAWQTLDTDRTVAIPGLFDRPTAHYQARTTQVFGEAGYAFALGAFTIEPFAGAAWVSVQTPQVSERGDVAALTIAAHDAAVGYSTLGLRAAGAIPLGAGAILIPRLSAAWQHAFNSLTPETVMTFQTTGTSFVVAGVTGARDTALAEAGLDVAIGPRLTLGASYIGSYARALMDHAVKGKLSWKL
jgi:outer membrane autotransporter protein